MWSLHFTAILNDDRGTSILLCQAEAERRLLTAALRQPRNQRFMLLSEACLPLYPPHVVWAEAFASQLSRVHACKADTPEDEDRRNLAKCAAAPDCS